MNSGNLPNSQPITHAWSASVAHRYTVGLSVVISTVKKYLRVNSFEAALRIIEGSAKSMGIEVVD
jgi:ribosomal protein L11